MFVAVTADPLWVTVAFQALVTFWSPGNVHFSDQLLSALVPVLLMVTLAVKPPVHCCGVYVTWQVELPPLVGDVWIGVGDALVRIGVGDELVRTGVGDPVWTLPPMLYEKLLTASPVPLTHGSNPAWTLVMYHEFEPNPRLTTSFQNELTLKLAEDVVCWRTYEMTFQPLLPSQTSQVAPAMFAVPTLEPTGCTEPVWLSQTISSAPVFWPSVRGVGSNQMSYEASNTLPLLGYVMLTLVWIVWNWLLLTCSGRPLPVLQLA